MADSPPTTGNPGRRSGQEGGSTAAGTTPIGDVQPRGTRQQWRRSSVLLDDGVAYVGTADGRVLAVDPGGDARTLDDSVGDRTVALARAGGDLVAGSRGADGWLRGLDPDGGDRRWSVRTADDVGEPARESLFYQPYVVDLSTRGGTVYAAARRYERSAGPGPDRSFESVVYAVEGGEVAWRYCADASVIAVEADGDRVAVAFNRCPGDHGEGLVVLDAGTGRPRWRWDPGGDGGRRVGALALVDGGIAVASHADYSGYLVSEGTASWRVDLGRPQVRGDDRVYAYPTGVEALDDAVAFVTGNTFPEEGRETEARHPAEHSLAVVADGSVTRRDRIGGWVNELAGDGDRLAVPCGQHFRDRDPSVHGVFLAGPEESERVLATEGPVVAVDAGAGLVAAVEEPIAFHDEEEIRGDYRSHFLDYVR